MFVKHEYFGKFIVCFLYCVFAVLCAWLYRILTRNSLNIVYSVLFKCIHEIPSRAKLKIENLRMKFDLSQYNFQAVKYPHEEQFIVSFMDVIAKVNDCDDNFSVSLSCS